MSENIGEYNRYILIEMLVGARDSLNQPLDQWVVLRPAWAKVRGQNGMAIIRSGEDVNIAIERNSWRILGYHPDITNAMRVNYNGQYHYIRQTRLDHANKEWSDLVTDTNSGDATPSVDYVGGGGPSDTPTGYVGGGSP